MLGFKRAKFTKKRVSGRKYKQVVVTAEAHKAIKKLADRNKTSMINQVNELMGI